MFVQLQLQLQLQNCNGKKHIEFVRILLKFEQDNGNPTKKAYGPVESAKSLTLFRIFIVLPVY